MYMALSNHGAHFILVGRGRGGTKGKKIRRGEVRAETGGKKTMRVPFCILSDAPATQDTRAPDNTHASRHTSNSIPLGVCTR